MLAYDFITEKKIPNWQNKITESNKKKKNEIKWNNRDSKKWQENCKTTKMFSLFQRKKGEEEITYRRTPRDLRDVSWEMRKIIWLMFRVMRKGRDCICVYKCKSALDMSTEKFRYDDAQRTNKTHKRLQYYKIRMRFFADMVWRFVTHFNNVPTTKTTRRRRRRQWCHRWLYNDDYDVVCASV